MSEQEKMYLKMEQEQTISYEGNELEGLREAEWEETRREKNLDFGQEENR